MNRPDLLANEAWFHLDRTGAPFFMDAYLKTWGLPKPEKFEKSYYPYGELEDAYLLFQGERFYGRWWSMKKFGVTILDYLIKGNNFEVYLKNKEKFKAKIDAIWEKYPREKVLAMSAEEAVAFALARQDDVVESWITDAIAPFMGEIASVYVEWWLTEKGVVGSERERIFNLVFAYPKVSATIERQLFIKERLDRANDYTREKIIADLVRMFAYSKSDFIGYIPYGPEDVLKEYEAARSIQLHTEKDMAEREETLQRFKVTQTERNVFDVFAFSMFSRDERRAYQQRLFALLDWALECLAGHYKIPHEILKYTLIDELTDANLRSESYKKILQDRHDNGFMISWQTRGTGRYLTGKDAWRVFNSLDEIKIEKVTEIKGQSTFKGKVQGVVKIIMNPKVPTPEGPFILVTGMTSPDYIQHMQKCSALITNEGGITCHAAILSRELKKPCIIGTKIATKVLKDGDLVEVDAEKGIVKIIK